MHPLEVPEATSLEARARVISDSLFKKNQSYNQSGGAGRRGVFTADW